MLTYDLSDTKEPLYKSLYNRIKADITSDLLSSGDKMPSKRTLAKNLGVSTITVENAYDQLISEGYLYSILKKGYYVSNIEHMAKEKVPVRVCSNLDFKKEEPDFVFDFSSNITESANFPFSVWAKMMRTVISSKEHDLLTISPAAGVSELRAAIAQHLSSFRGMSVNPNQIIIGSGTEYLYSLLTSILGRDKIYCIENPGYGKLKQIYEMNQIHCCLSDMDEYGILVENLRKTNAHIAHISPAHHFPTGITMPISRRYELLAWANESEGRYIIEDDYDSEFRLNGHPLPTLQSIDVCEKVVYMNTFSKSLSPTIRISYMVLPEHLAASFYEHLSFMSCTVSNFEQYTLAAFISQGYFEKHINRMRLHYGRKRSRVLEIIRKELPENKCKIIENDSGLHFLLEFNTKLPDQELKEKLLEKKIRINPITDYFMDGKLRNQHQFIINYSNIDVNGLADALNILKECN